MRIGEKQFNIIRLKLFGLRKKVDFWSNGLGVRGKNLGFLADAKFQQALQFAYEGNKEGWKKRGSVPQMPWRIYTALWAAKNAMNLEGDMVECGVHTGLLSMAICHYLEFDKVNKRFYLFDTYEGIPEEGAEGSEKELAKNYNAGIYFDVYDIVKRNFSRFPNVQIVKGILPESLSQVNIEKISYLSIDLNNARYEKETIEALWDKLVTGAMVVIDDYAFMGHIPQYEMWNEFAKSKGRMVYTSPTGQGLLQK